MKKDKFFIQKGSIFIDFPVDLRSYNDIYVASFFEHAMSEKKTLSRPQQRLSDTRLSDITLTVLAPSVQYRVNIESNIFLKMFCGGEEAQQTVDAALNLHHCLDNSPLSASMRFC